MFDIEFNPKESFLKQELAVSGITNNIDPWTIGLTAAQVGGSFLGSGILGNDGSADREGRARKRAARKAGKEQDRANREQYRFQWGKDGKGGEAERQYQYALETTAIRQENSDIQIQAQQDRLDQQYAYDMSIRQFNYDQQVKLRNQQVQQAEQQIGFNQDAFLLGMKQQEVFVEEQELNFEFEQIGLDVQQENANYTGRLNERMNDTNQRNARALQQLKQQATTVEGLKEQGRARASGQTGRSAGKSVQAAFAENGAKQALLAEQTTQVGEQYALTAQQNVNELDKIYKELFMSNNQLDASRASLKRADIFARANMTLELKQANADALNKIMLMPELAPEIPAPPNLSDYAPVFAEPFRPEAPPEPRESVPYIPPANPGGNSFLDALPAIGATVAGIGSIVAKAPNNKPAPKPDAYNAGFNMAQGLIN